MIAPLLLLASLAAAEPPARVLDRVAATVNGEVITQLEVGDRAGPDLRRAEAQPPGPARDRARAKALRAAFDSIVAERLFAAQVAALGVDVAESEIDSVIDDIKRRNNLDDAHLEQALAQQGMDRAAYRKAVKRDLESMRILSVKVRNRVKVTDEDVKNYWQTHPREFTAGEEAHVRHIFLAAPTTASAEDEARARTTAEKALQRVRAGEDFATVARQLSQGPSAAEGGELGWIKRGTIQPDIEKAVFGLQAGQVSDVVRTRTGYQILQVLARRGGGVRPLDEVKDEIRDRLVNEQSDNYRTQFIAELRKDAVVDIKLPELKPEPWP
jgi:peptidyl-prolyl cis-trans isomerase SurA